MKAGDRILLADGFLELRVRSVNGSEIHCVILVLHLEHLLDNSSGNCSVQFLQNQCVHGIAMFIC